MAYSFVQYPISSTTVGPFNITFPYLQTYHVEVRKNNALLTPTTDYTFPTPTTIQLVANAVNGDVVELRRNSLKKNLAGTVGRMIDFTNSSKLIETDLDTDGNQTFYTAQEAFDAAANAMQLSTDNTFDALSKRIKNVASPTQVTDAVNKAYVDAASLGGSSFFAAGSGAVARPWQDKNRDIVSVKDFGAVGDGVTDDGAAITAAIASVGVPYGGTIYFPYGIYAYATSPNFAKGGLSIVCAQGTQFKHTGTGNAFLIDAGSGVQFVNGLNFENIQVQGNVNSTNGIYARGVGRSTFKNIWVTGCAITGAALRCDFALLNTWVNFKVSNSVPVPKYGIFLSNRGVGEQTTTQTFINPTIEGVTTANGAGIYIDVAGTNLFIGGTSEGNFGGAFISQNGYGVNTFIGTDFEGNSSFDIDIRNTKNTFENILSLGNITITTATSTKNMFIGGRLTNVTTDVNCSGTALLGADISNVFTDNSPSTQVFTYGSSAITGQFVSSKAANSTLNAANATLKLYDGNLGAGLFGQQTAGAPYAYVLSVADGGFSQFFPLALHGKFYPGKDDNTVQTAAGIYGGTGAPNNANGNNGDFYFRSDGGAGTSVYMKRAGVWVGIL